MPGGEPVVVCLTRRTLEQAMFALSTVAWDPEQLDGVRDEARGAVEEIRDQLTSPPVMVDD